MPDVAPMTAEHARAATHEEKAPGGPRRTVALISYDWSTRIMGGSVRALSFANHLPEYGWSPVVLTASPPDEWPDPVGDVHPHFLPSPERSFGGGITGSPEEATLDGNPAWLRGLAVLKRALPLERQLTWFPSFRREAPGICRRHGVEAVVSVTAPYVMMLAGHWLARRLGVPHIVDLRDDWLDRFSVEPLSRAYRGILNAYAGWVVRRADGLSVVSPLTRDRFERQGIDARLVMNGYVESAFEDVAWAAPTIAADGPLRIVHLGWLGDFRSVGPVLDAIRGLIADGAARSDDFVIEQYGLIEPGQQALLDGGAPCPTVIGGQLPHEEAIRIMTDADALLVIPGDRVPAALSGKLFEYLRARRPILLIAEPGAARSLSSSLGVQFIASPTDPGAVREAVATLLERKRAGSLRAGTDPSDIRALDRRRSAGRLAALITEVTS